MNEYLNELYNWIQSEDNTFKQRYTFEDFQNNMQEGAYAQTMYDWISGVDSTFTERYTIDEFNSKVKKKLTPTESLESGLEETLESGLDWPPQ